MPKNQSYEHERILRPLMRPHELEQVARTLLRRVPRYVVSKTAERPVMRLGATRKEGAVRATVAVTVDRELPKISKALL